MAPARGRGRGDWDEDAEADEDGDGYGGPMDPRWRPRGWDYPPPSRPLPADGIKARSKRGPIGDTWWSQRFIEVLESFSMGARLQRGRRYARAGQVLEFEVAPGRVTASVQGSRARPYQVLVAVETLAEADWRRVEEAMAGKAVFLAKLLAGEMPQNIEEAFAQCKLSLFPASVRELDTACSCPDWANPCKHVAAVYFLLAEAFDADPFLVFAWRGRPQGVLLDALRARRGAGAAAAGAAAEAEAGDGWPPPRPRPLDDALAEGRFWAAGAELETVRPRPRRAAVPDAVVRLLEPVDVLVRGRSPADVLAPAYERITAAAYERAMRGAEPAADGGHGAVGATVRSPSP